MDCESYSVGGADVGRPWENAAETNWAVKGSGAVFIAFGQQLLMGKGKGERKCREGTEYSFLACRSFDKKKIVSFDDWV